MKRMGFRQWLAWRLVRLAHRFYDPEWHTEVVMVTPTGKKLVLHIVEDEYGAGISSTDGIAWDPTGKNETAEVEGWSFLWSDPVRHAEYMEGMS